MHINPNVAVLAFAQALEKYAYLKPVRGFVLSDLAPFH